MDAQRNEKSLVLSNVARSFASSWSEKSPGFFYYIEISLPRSLIVYDQLGRMSFDCPLSMAV